MYNKTLVQRENPPAIVLGSLLRKDHRLWDRSLSQHPEGELESGNEEMEVEQGGGVGVDSEGENEAEVDERIVYEADNDNNNNNNNASKALTSTFDNKSLNLLFDQVVGLYQQLPPVIVVDLAPDVVYWDLTPSLEPFLNKWFNSEGNNASVWRLEKWIVRAVLERLRRTQGPTFHDLWSSAKGVTQAEILRVGSMSSYSQPFGGGRGNKHQDRLRRRRYRRI
ncbi:hypothetical protein BGX23_002830 [Mortierella sp. AD031]|nr:hypothetical protein BGX23_002830 [Mortierella sp. AD031]